MSINRTAGDQRQTVSTNAAAYQIQVSDDVVILLSAGAVATLPDAAPPTPPPAQPGTQPYPSPAVPQSGYEYDVCNVSAAPQTVAGLHALINGAATMGIPAGEVGHFVWNAAANGWFGVIYPSSSSAAALSPNVVGPLNANRVVEMSGDSVTRIVTQDSGVKIHLTEGGTIPVPTQERMLEWQPTDPSYAPFSFNLEPFLFNGVTDYVLAHGYNVDNEVVTEPQMRLGWESHYNNGVTHLLEINWDLSRAISLGVLPVRSLSISLNRVSGDADIGFSFRGATGTVYMIDAASQVRTFQMMQNQLQLAPVTGANTIFTISQPTGDLELLAGRDAEIQGGRNVSLQAADTGTAKITSGSLLVGTSTTTYLTASVVGGRYVVQGPNGTGFRLAAQGNSVLSLIAPGSFVNTDLDTSNGRQQFVVSEAGVTYASVGRYAPGVDTAFGAVWLGQGVGPNNVNHTLAGDGATISVLNAPTGGKCGLSINGNDVVEGDGGASADGLTALLMICNRAGVKTMSRVKFGAANSGPGGVGRALYVDN